MVCWAFGRERHERQITTENGKHNIHTDGFFLRLRDVCSTFIGESTNHGQPLLTTAITKLHIENFLRKSPSIFVEEEDPNEIADDEAAKNKRLLDS